MKNSRSVLFLRTALVVAAAVPFAHAAPKASRLVTLSFGSDTSWEVSDVEPTECTHASEAAQLVCLNNFAPANCPASATQYGFGGYGWGADLSGIPLASWIWAPVAGDTAPAEYAEFWFRKTFELNGVPTGGTIGVAADDFAEVFVNGQRVGDVGSITDVSDASTAQSQVEFFDVGAYLMRGTNTVVIHAQNGPASYSGCGENCSYGAQPAAVAFGGEFGYEPSRQHHGRPMP